MLLLPERLLRLPAGKPTHGLLLLMVTPLVAAAGG
jgi:hypothetical protein